MNPKAAALRQDNAVAMSGATIIKAKEAPQMLNDKQRAKKVLLMLPLEFRFSTYSPKAKQTKKLNKNNILTVFIQYPI